MKKGKISASMMCADLNRIFQYLEDFEKEKIEFLHLDVMDGDFVPNLALGTDYVRSLRKNTNLVCDYHFLVEDPMKKMPWFDIRDGDQVAFHYEKNDKIEDCIKYVKEKGAKVFIAINPATDFYKLNAYFPDIDGILIMMVNPGFAGQKMLPFTINKVEQLNNYLRGSGFENIEIEVDGNISPEKAKILYEKGATIFVAGTSSLFSRKEKTMLEKINELRNVIGW